MSERIIATFGKGKDDCEHNWVYSHNGRIQMTYPQSFKCSRVCDKCGKYQMVELDKMPKSSNNFNEIVKQFGTEA